MGLSARFRNAKEGAEFALPRYFSGIPNHTPMNHSRRAFLVQASAVGAGFLGLQRHLAGATAAPVSPYGPLVRDPAKLLDLPVGFRYTVLSRTGDRMSDGFKVPGQFDGMAAFALGADHLALVRNHEIGHSGFTLGPFDDNSRLPEGMDPAMVYDAGRFGAQPFVGGTTTLVYDQKTQSLTSQYLSLIGTDRNCAGGTTPWGSWITCEEPADMTTQWGVYHGYCFEVPARAEIGLVKPEPLKALGRFRHEAIAIDPRTGIMYLTEDRNDGVIYRFLPDQPDKLTAGGRLQALGLVDGAGKDTRNWPGGTGSFPIRERLAARWIDLDEVDTPADDLRLRAVAAGAVIFSRGEGMWWAAPGVVDEASIYWACTDGGKNLSGQIFRYFPSSAEGTAGEAEAPGHVELYLEPNDTALLKNGDNVTVAPSGHLFICEDGTGTNLLRGVTREGDLYSFARNASNDSELAGVCFSPDGSTLFLNIQTPGITLAVTGPFVGA
jgi:hypothetical protein